MTDSILARAFALVVVASLVAVACGSSSDTSDPVDSTTTTTSSTAPGSVDSAGAVPVVLELPARVSDPERGSAADAGAAITAFGSELFSAARSERPHENVSLSPASVAIALAMLEPGATGQARIELRALLNIDDAPAFHASMNALEQDLEARTPPDFGEDDDPGDLAIRIANAAYLQQGYPFTDDYLGAIGTDYGPILHTVDFGSDPDTVAEEINAFIAEATADRIPDLLQPGDVKPDTVLALVNALYLDASWLEPFGEARTADAPFTLIDGSQVVVPMMQAESGSSAQGDGWVGATKTFTGGLYAQFVLPDEGRFDDVAATFGSIPVDFGSAALGGDRLALPRFETRTKSELPPILRSMGLLAPFEPGNLLGIAGDPKMYLDNVLHEAYVSLDEDGIEAAAATVALVGVVSSPPPGVPVVLDRPFLYRIVDRETGTVLFVGQVLDPTT